MYRVIIQLKDFNISSCILYFSVSALSNDATELGPCLQHLRCESLHRRGSGKERQFRHLQEFIVSYSNVIVSVCNCIRVLFR